MKKPNSALLSKKFVFKLSMAIVVYISYVFVEQGRLDPEKIRKSTVSYKSAKDLPKEDEVKELRIYVGKYFFSLHLYLSRFFLKKNTNLILFIRSKIRNGHFAHLWYSCSFPHIYYKKYQPECRRRLHIFARQLFPSGCRHGKN